MNDPAGPAFKMGVPTCGTDRPLTPLESLAHGVVFWLATIGSSKLVEPSVTRAELARQPNGLVAAMAGAAPVKIATENDSANPKRTSTLPFIRPPGKKLNAPES